MPRQFVKVGNRTAQLGLNDQLRHFAGRNVVEFKLPLGSNLSQR